jgi:hypothetical protein
VDISRRWRIPLNVLAVLVTVGLVALFVYIEFVAEDEPPAKAGPLGPVAVSARPTLSVAPAPLPPGSTAPSTSTSVTPSPTKYTGDDRNGGSPVPGAREVAEGFGRALTNVQGGQQAWYKRLAAFLSPHQAAQYKNVPTENAPTGNLLRADLNQLADVVAEARLTYDTGLVIDIRLAFNAVKWEVVSVVDRVIPGTSPEGAR